MVKTPVTLTATTRRKCRGFTLIELLVVLAVLAILASLVAPNYLDRVGQAREAVLKHDLAGLRTAIDQHYRDKARYPDSLDDLVTARYIREVPLDPVTGRNDSWTVIAPTAGSSGVAPTGKVFDVRSGAAGAASDGSTYASW